MPGNIHDAVKLIRDSRAPEPSQEEPKAAAPTEDEPVSAPSQEEPKAEERITVKVGDEELSLTLEELKLGYMKGSDYQRKTTEAKRLREQYEATTTEFSQALQDATALLDMDIAELQADTELREYDPDEYLKRFEKLEKRTVKLKELKEKERKAKEQKRQEKLLKEQERLREAIPEWLDSDKQQTEITKALEVLSKTGFTEQELSTLSDHRLLVMARKAALYDEIKSQDLKRKEVKEAPKVSAPSGGAPTSEVSSVADSYRKNPTRAGLAAVIKELRAGKRYR